MSNGGAKRIVGTIKRAVMESVQKDGDSWAQAVLPVTYGYRRRSIADRFSPCQLICRVPLRLSGTESGSLLLDNTFDEQTR